MKSLYPNFMSKGCPAMRLYPGRGDRMGARGRAEQEHARVPVAARATTAGAAGGLPEDLDRSPAAFGTAALGMHRV